MAKQLNVNLAFTANTSEAKKELSNLQTQLDKIVSMPIQIGNSSMSKEILEASNAAAELKVHLEQATNVKTGNLDFTKLNQSLKKSGTSLSDYGNKLKAIGPAGNTAFQALAQSVAKAEIPIRRSNAALNEMWTTLKNTARWQISSSILHGFMGAVQSAYGYAQDLNASLNDIRIVTGQNIDQMSRFAEQANKAAKALSATTTEYTEASLIYYQQGLSDAEVAKRTEVTVKMANAAGQSAQIVSDQLTAVWNNFYDGSKSLEYYADVMTALGAATASSTDEIAGGLEKFAAVAETIGLSYEYAASALATITSNTRQSEEVVGTALKTIFARIQGLNLGETLEDGTTLNKYSEALEKVGISIFESNGEIKKMDDILDEMAAKWQTLAKDQQIALAQTVAGVRQYNQLVSLMDNWDSGDSDSMTANLSTAYNSSGELQKQADVYAESWEAAEKRVQAAAEAIYSDLINDEFFIDLLNGFEKFLTLIDTVIDSMGGLQGVLSAVSALLFKMFSSQISQGITNMAYNLKMMTSAGQKEAQVEKQTFLRGAVNDLTGTGEFTTVEESARANSLQNELQLQSALIENAEKMSGIELEVNKQLMDRQRLLGEEVAKRSAIVDKAKEKTATASQNVRAQALETTRMWTTDDDPETKKKAIQETNEALHTAGKNTKKNIAIENNILRSVDKVRDQGEVAESTLKALEKAMTMLKKKGATAFDDILKDLPKVGDSAEEVEDKLRQIAAAAREAVDELATSDYADAGVLRPSDDGAVDNVQELTDAYREEIAAVNDKKAAETQEAQAMASLEARIKNATGLSKSWSDGLVNMAQGVSSAIAGFSALGAAMNTLSNPDMSGWEKFISIAMSLGTAVPMIISGFKTMGAELGSMNTQMIATAAAQTLLNTKYKDGIGQQIVAIAMNKAMTKEEKIAEIMSIAKIGRQEAEIALENGLVAAKGKNVAATLLSNAAAKLASVFGITLAGAKTTETGAVAANTAAWYANPIMWIALVIVGVVAALVGLIAIIGGVSKALSDAYNADAIAAENAETAAENLAKRYEDVKASYEEMIGAMENYQSARDALDELTKGTTEYEEALQKANAAALELLQNYPEYFTEGDYSWQDGELVISEEAMNRAKQAELDKVQNAQAAATMAQAGAKQARAVANATEMKRAQRDEMGIGDGDLVWKGIGTALLAGVTSAIPGIGGIVATGLLGGAYGNEVKKAGEYDAAVDSAMSLYADDQNLFTNYNYLAEKMAEVGVTNTDLIQALWDNRDGLVEMGNEFNAAAMQMKVAAENVANNLVQGNEKVQESGEADSVAAVTAKAYEKAYKDEQEKALADIKDRGLFNTGTDDAKALMAEYAKISGLDQDSNYEVTNYVGDGSVMVKKTLEDGSVEEVKLTAEEIAATVAAERANAQVNASMETVMADMLALNKKIDTDGDGVKDTAADKSDQALRDFLMTGKLEGASKGELEELQKEVIVKGDGTVWGDLEALQATAANLDATLSGSPEDYGYSSWLEMAEALGEAAEKTEEAWNNIELPEGLENTADLSLEAAKKIQQDMESLSVGSQGAEGIKTYTEGINQLTASMTEAQKNQFMNEIGNVDWSSWYAMDDVTALLDSMGAELNMTTEELEAFTEAMRIAGGASPTEMLARTKSNIEALGATLSEGIAPGSVLDEETYAKLIEANKELEGQFMKTIDGSYKYVGEKELGLEQLDMGEYLETTREMSNLYEQAKDDAADIDFKGLSTVDYNFADERKAQQDAINAAQKAYDDAEEAHSDGFLGIKITTNEEQIDLNNKQAAVDKAEADLEAMNQANEQAKQALSDNLTSVINSDDLLAVAEYCNYTEDQLKEMQANVAAGNEDAIKEAQEFNRQMNIFMAAGANGEYNISEAEEQIASTATSIEELDALTEKYALSQETYAKAITGLFADAAAGAKSLEELDEIKQQVLDAGGTVSDDIYLENVKRLSEEAMNAATSMDALAQAKYDAESRGAEVDPELYTENIKRIAEETVKAADSFADLEAAWGQALATGAELDTSAYNEKLIELGNAYENCADEVKAFEQALLSNDPALVEEAKSLLEVAVELNELAEAYGLDAEATANYADRLADGNATTADAKRAFGQMAIAAQRLDRGVRNINDNLGDYKKVIKTANRDSFEFSETMDALKTDIADMFNVADGNMFSDTFAEALLDSEDFKKVLDGDVEALDRLRASATVDIGDNIIKQLGDAADTVHYKLDEAGNQIANSAYTASGAWDYVRSVLADGFTLEEINNEQFVNSLNDMISASGMTKEQIQSMLGSMGVSAEVVTDYKEMETEVPTYYERSVPDGVDTFTGIDMDGQVQTYTRPRIKKMTIPGKPEKVMGYVPTYSVKTTSGDTSSGGSIDYSNTFTKASPPSISSSSTSAGGGGGGGGSSSPSKMEKRDPTKKSDTVERYREVTDAIDNVTDALTRAERATDRLWGKDKLKAMKEENKILEEQRDLLLQKAEEAEEYAREDAANLRKVAQDIGVSVVIDQNTGDISNIEDVEETLHNRLSAAEAEYNRKVEAYNAKVAQYGENLTQQQADELESMKDAIDAYETDVIGDIEKDISAWEDAEQQFQSSVEEWENAGLEAEEILDQIMQNNYDIIMEGLEIPLSLNEEDLRLVELQLSRIEDDVYSMAEAVALTSSQFGEYQDNLRLADEALAELEKQHQLYIDTNGQAGITDAAYQEGLGEIRDKYYENVEALMELDNTMMEYYSNTIDMANEELSKYTDQIEHQTSVLEHYSSLIEMMGKSSDYKMMGKVLEGQVKTTKDAMTVSKQWYETQRANADSLAAEYAAAQARGASEEELELIKANWDAAESAANEAQDKMLSDAEAWAEALKAVLENKLADLGQTLENALTGGTSFDTINTQMERAQSLQEEYLTTTNQIYETNKLMRTAQQEIDKTTNSVAKKRLQAYIAETEQLQNQSKLSQYELEIQQAKYDLLLAEIALEEAQDAKSTVRLQRDSEGNFGYVYTADQNKLAEAQQQLEDAQNSLYNIGLEGANDYAQKYQQTMQEMYDTFADLQQQKLDGAFKTEEEYHRAMEEAKAYYYQKLQDYSGLYSVAITTDSRVVADAWSSDFADMVYDTDEWMSAVDQYVADVELAFKEWSDAVHDPSTGITAIIGGDVHAVGEKVDEVTQKSADLAKTTTEKVIPALDAELDAVQNMTGAYAAMRQEIQAVIEEYTNMINRINNSQTNEWNSGDSGDGSSDGTGDGEGTGGEGSGNGGGDGTGDGQGTEGGDGEGTGGGQETGTDSYRYGTIEFRGNGANRVWIDEAGKQYAYNSSQGKALQTAFNKAFGRNGGYKGDYWIGWTDAGGKLKADILREKDGLATGGYTGEWAGSYGKLALLHQKELVLNAQDTENLLTSMEVLNKIVEMIDLQSMSSQLGGMLNSPSLGLHSSEVLEQNVHIEASFPGVQDRNEIEEAFNNLINKASQFANRK